MPRALPTKPEVIKLPPSIVQCVYGEHETDTIESRVQAPWTAKPERLAADGVKLGEDDSLPIAERNGTRQRALDALPTLAQSA